MALTDDLKTQVTQIFKEKWTERDGTKVPEPEDLKLSNDAVKLEGTVLYADLAESTALVDSHSGWFAAEIYKAYLHCASKIIRHYGGEITAFDGDRVMAVFIGGMKNTNAARTALAINHSVVHIINPLISECQPSVTYRVKHAIGIDTSSLFVARTGIRNYNDLVWVGTAANRAAKLSGLRDDGKSSWISSEVYNSMEDSSKIYNGSNMWEKRRWTAYGVDIYCSSWHWAAGNDKR